MIAEVAEGMAGKLQRSLDFFLSTTADAKLARIYLCGGTAKVPALQRALEQKSHTPVEILDPVPPDHHRREAVRPGVPAAARGRGGGGGGPGAAPPGGQVVIRINLLRAASGRAGRRQPAPAAVHGRRPAGARWAAIVVVHVHGVAARWASCRARTRRLQTDIDRLKAELGDYDKVKAQREELLKQRKSIAGAGAGPHRPGVPAARAVRDPDAGQGPDLRPRGLRRGPAPRSQRRLQRQLGHAPRLAGELRGEAARRCASRASPSRTTTRPSS